MTDIRAGAYEALAKRAVLLGNELKTTVSMPNVSFDPPVRSGKREPYVVFSFMPNDGGLDGLAFDGGETYFGLAQFSVFWPAGEGLLKPAKFAGQVAAYFPAGLWLVESGIDVRFDRAPAIAPPLQESDLVQVPVTIRWRATASAA